jgi:hypothetical protein
MKLFIRSQNKQRLSKVDDIYYVADGDFWAIRTNRSALDYAGLYPTEERCLEIIDEIQKLLLRANGDYIIKLQDIDVNAEEKTVYGENFIQKLQSPIMPIANEPSVQLVQPSVLVYEMPKE